MVWENGIDASFDEILKHVSVLGAVEPLWIDDKLFGIAQQVLYEVPFQW